MGCDPAALLSAEGARGKVPAEEGNGGSAAARGSLPREDGILHPVGELVPRPAAGDGPAAASHGPVGRDRSFRYVVHRAPVGRALERHQRPQRRDLGPAHVRVLPQQRAPEDGGSPHEPARHRHLNATRAGTPVLEVSPGEESMSRSERSEEHTSELQSLMRISYAVFCLKKKKKDNISKNKT